MFLLNVYNRLGIKAKILLIGLVPLVLAAVFLVVMAIGSLKQNLLQLLILLQQQQILPCYRMHSLH